MKLIVGLGNPGSKYEGTRHNIGFAIADQLAAVGPSDFKRKRFQGLVTEVMIESEKVILLKPQTFMNLSGESVQECLQYFKLSSEELLVIHDDIDFPLGTVRLNFNVGPAGHRGVTSIIEEVGSKEFYRLRCGVGRPATSTPETVDHVLERFESGEQEAVQQLITVGAEAGQMWVTEEASQVQQKFHTMEN